MMTQDEHTLIKRMGDDQLAVVELCGHSREVRAAARSERQRRADQVMIDVVPHAKPLVRIPWSGR
ncbi:hypothetical protein [Nocardiopsis lucentensis]|uniref:hypothetical protein n=1 Tax=Nocardiopsis lucentensis TaxID=53441 RepID=UPI000344A74C|nr:hypothetical protein [Nocardiopsis lucentensis]